MKLYISILLLIMVSAAEARTLKPADFAYGHQVQVSGSAPFCEFALPDDLYRGVTRSDLSDMALFNGSGELIPFAIRPTAPAEPVHLMAELPLFDLKTRRETSAHGMAVQVTAERERAMVQVGPAGAAIGEPSVRTYFADASGLRMPVVALDLHWENGADFLAKLKLEASDNLEDWRTVIEGATVARLVNEGSLFERRMVEFPSVSAKYLRISFPQGETLPRLLKVTAKLAGQGTQDRRWITVSATGQEKPGEYIFDLKGFMPVDRVQLEFPEPNSVARSNFFVRQSDKEPWRPVTAGTLYRLRSGEEEIVSSDLSFAPVIGGQWLVRFGSGSRSANPPQLTAGWVPQRVVFVPQGKGPYTVAYGSKNAVAARQPELLTLVEQQKGEVATATLGPRLELGGDRRREESQMTLDGKNIVLWSILICGVGLLAWMSVQLHRQMKRDNQAQSKE